MNIEPTIHECECEICKTGFDVEIKARHQRINLLLSRLNEPQQRWYVASLSEDANGLSARQWAIITGLDEKAIRRGKAELREQVSALPVGRQRRVGGGRLRAEKKTRS